MKQTIPLPWPKSGHKIDLGFEIWKTNAGIKISILEIHCVPIFRQILKANVTIRISILQIPCIPIFRQTDNLEFFDPNLPKYWLLGSEFQQFNSRFGISTIKIPPLAIFSQNWQLRNFQPKFCEIAQLRAIFWF